MAEFVKKERISRWTTKITTVTYVFTGFPKVIAEIVGSYCATLKLLDWIDPVMIHMDAIWANPNAIESGFVRCDPNDTSDVDLWYFNMNPHPDAFKLLRITPADKSFVFNPHPDTMRVLREANITYEISDIAINSSDAVYDILLKSGKIDTSAWPEVFANSNPRIVKILEQEVNSGRKIDWDNLSSNSSDWAINLLKRKTDKINLQRLTENPHPWAIDYFRQHQSEIDWEWFSTNPAIFKYGPSELADALSE